MADKLEQVMEALRNADASGNIEDAKKLAVIADKLRNSATDMSEKTESIGAMPFTNKAIAETVGMPLDLIPNTVEQPAPEKAESLIGDPQLLGGASAGSLYNVSRDPDKGSNAVKSLMKSAGIVLPEEGITPKTLSENIGRGIGETAGMLLPMGVGVKALSKGSGIAGKISKTVFDSIAKHPYIAMTSELTGGGGMGAGRVAGEELFPESPTAQNIGEIAGGAVGGMVPTALALTPGLLALKGGKTLLRKMSMPFTEKGVEYRAGKFLKSLVTDPEKTANDIGDQTISNLPPAVAAGEKRLTSLYKSLIGQDAKVDSDAIEEISNSVMTLQKEMRKLGYGSPEVLKEITKKRIAALELRMDKRVASAMEAARNKFDKIPAAFRNVEESRIVRNELERVMEEEKALVRKLWLDVPKDYEVGFGKTRETYSDIVGDLAEAQKTDIPNVLKINSIITSKKLKSTTVKEMQGLRSKLLETARIARKDGNWNKARIADEVSEAILEDLGIASGEASTPEAASLQAALAGTKKVKTRFENGIVGKVLGYSKSGAPAVSPDLTLDISIGRMGAKGSVDAEKVAITPEAIAATERYLGRSFTDFATDKTTNAINPTKARGWIKANEEILDKFPNLREKLSDIPSSQEFANKTRSVMEARKKALRNPSISSSAKFLNSVDMDKTIDTMLKYPKMASEMALQAKRDQTGDALNGLRAAFIDNILDKSSVGAYNDLGEQTLSGNTLLNYVNKNMRTIQKVFSPEQIGRMKKIGSELSKIEAFENTKSVKPEIEMKDVASKALSIISRAQFARLGGFMGKQSMGGSLQMANIYSKEGQELVLKFTKDRAAQLVQDAIISKDPSLLRALLLPLDKPKSAATNWRIVNKRLNAWLAGKGKRVLDDITQEYENDKKAASATTKKQPEIGAESTRNPQEIRYDSPGQSSSPVEQQSPQAIPDPSKLQISY